MTAHELANKLLEGPDLPVCHLVTSEIDGSDSAEAIESLLEAPNNDITLPVFWDDSNGDHLLTSEPVIMLFDRNI